ncbi:MAG: ATP-binding protein [Planctomycetia bacterium]|nr:ATP-binding protein [Planctomycetia bacterium]
MQQSEFERLLADLLSRKGEREWVEFKHNNDNPEEIGEYLSALSNGAALHGEPFGFMVWGIEDGTRNVVGTSFTPRKKKIGNQELENWLTVQLHPQIEFTIHEHTVGIHPVVLFRVRAAHHAPIRFKGTEYIRVGTYKKKLADHQEHERRLWRCFPPPRLKMELRLSMSQQPTYSGYSTMPPTSPCSANRLPPLIKAFWTS